MTGEFEYPTSSQPVLGCLDSYGKKSWILVDFLVDPIVCMSCVYLGNTHVIVSSSYMNVHIHTGVRGHYVATYDIVAWSNATI